MAKRDGDARQIEWTLSGCEQQLQQDQQERDRLRAILRVVAECSENDDVPFGQHLCVEQVRVEVARHREALRKA